MKDSDLTWLARNVHEWEQGCHYLIKTLDNGFNWIVGEMECRDNAANYYTKQQWLDERARLKMTDLEWLARNVHEWPKKEQGRFVSASKYYGQYGKGIVDCKSGTTKQQWLEERARLQNKPSWDDAPEWANWLAQDSDGRWHWYECNCEPMCEQFDEIGYGSLSKAGKGEVLGDWRNTLEKRPERIVDADKKVEPSGQPLDMAKRYPKYYKDVSNLSDIDVYAVHELFGIDDPSGCVQHASKKLLLCGVRTGGKDVATEIKEARDTLTRKLQLMGIE